MKLEKWAKVRMQKSQWLLQFMSNVQNVGDWRGASSKTMCFYHAFPLYTLPSILLPHSSRRGGGGGGLGGCLVANRGGLGLLRLTGLDEGAGLAEGSLRREFP